MYSVQRTFILKGKVLRDFFHILFTLKKIVQKTSKKQLLEINHDKCLYREHIEILINVIQSLIGI